MQQHCNAANFKTLYANYILVTLLCARKNDKMSVKLCFEIPINVEITAKKTWWYFFYHTL